MTDAPADTTAQQSASTGAVGAELAAPQMFSVVSSERKFDGQVASVRVDEVVMPGGGTAKREVVEHGGAVAVVALDTAGPLDLAAGVEVVDSQGIITAEPADMVILIEQYRHPLGRRLWELPAGLLDVEDEPALAAAKRELYEETGYAAEHWAVLLDVATSPGFTEEIVRIYLATGLTLGARPDSEHEEADLRVVRVPLSVAVESALAGRIVNLLAVAGILAADAVLRGSAVIVDRSDESQHDQDQAWTVHRGPGAPAAPVLSGIAPAVDGPAPR
jgi:8-oxo-dGTP pyrophosphatase MutT (NUDIX family)